MKNTLKGIIKKGLAHVLGASVINKVISLLSSVIIVRILTKSDYGYYGWAYNIVSIFLLMSGLGINTGILQFCSEKIEEQKKKDYYKFGFIYNFAVNIVVILSLLIYATFLPVSMPEGRWLLQIMSALPLLDSMYNYLLSYLRTRLNNRLFATATNIHSVSHFVLMIGGAFLWGLYGYVAGYYISHLIAIAFIVITSRNDLAAIARVPVMKAKKAWDLIKYSFICACNNAVSQMLYILDVFLIGIVISQADVIASYKASVTIPTAMQFLTSSVLIVVYPYFAKNRENRSWVKANAKKLILGLSAVNGLVGAFLFFGAPLIIHWVYGDKYIDAVPVFRVLAVSYVINTSFKMVFGQLLAMLRKVSVNFFLTMITGVANIALDIALINQFGSIGAAYATLAVVAIDSLMSGIYLVWYTNKISDESDVRKI